MNSFNLHILAADKTFYDGDCYSLVIPTTDGQYGIQAYHRNAIAAIVPGVLELTTVDNEKIIAAVSDGLAKIEDNEVLILVDTAELPEEIDANRAKRAADAAKERMLQQRSMQEYYSAQASLARAISRLKAKGGHSGIDI